MTAPRGARSIVGAALLIAGLVVVALPYLWILLTAFKRQIDATAVPPVIFSPITFEQLGEAALRPVPRDRSGARSIITVGTVVATLGLGVPAGYAFARGRFRGRRFLGGWLLFSRMMPPVIFIIPLFMYFHQLRLVNTYQGLILAYMTGLAAVHGVDDGIVLRRTSPSRSRRRRGWTAASRFRAFLVVLPLALPGVLTVGVLIGIAAWSEYFIPFILAGPGTTPATVGLVNFIGSAVIDWGQMAAASLTLVLPVLVVTIIAQRGLLRGLSAGAVKG